MLGLICFDESNGPLINSEFGEARIVEVDFDSITNVATEANPKMVVQVIFSVLTDNYDPSNFYVGFWGVEYITKVCGGKS